MIPPALAAERLVPIPAGAKGPPPKGWPNMQLSLGEAEAHVAAGGNLAMRLVEIVDADLDSAETIELAPIYLPTTDAKFGRFSKSMSHWLYRAPGAVFAAFADPLDGTMLVELRANGKDGGAHLTLLPPSVTNGERRAWDRHLEAVEPAIVDAAVLTRRVAWLAIGALVMRHLSEHAARRPGPDMPALLWETDTKLGRAAYRWLGERAPDDPELRPKHRRDMTREEIDLAELVAAIPNNLDWTSWNRLGMAIFAASGGSNEGAIVFDDFSAKSPKYNPYITAERWTNYRRSPPGRIGIGSLVYLALQHGWRGVA
jgi:hypothetical protein